MLARQGAAVVDTDDISRQLTAAGGAAIPEIARIFGAQFVNEAGALDREAMRALVFSDPAAKRRLEAIIHPLVAGETARQSLKAEQDGARCLVFDVPLLVESARWRPLLHQILVIDCSEETQISRVMARSGWPRETVERVMAGQADRTLRLASADICLFNETESLDELASLVRQTALIFGL
jgi:dephospho-CoA kinase